METKQTIDQRIKETKIFEENIKYQDCCAIINKQKTNKEILGNRSAADDF